LEYEAVNRSLEGSITAGPKGRQKDRIFRSSKEFPMKGTRGFGGSVDLGTIFDEIFEAARDFQNEFRKSFNGNGTPGDCNHGDSNPWFFDENTDYYPNYSYPPMNVFMTGDRGLVFEFALAGFEEKDISLSFQGDYMVFQATMPHTVENQNESVRYFKRRLKMKSIDKQKYFVPLDKYAQENVKAVFRNGILRVSIPPKEEPDQNNGIKIEIVT
jgi:HSP20 family molecular chaperone IbpA